MTVKELITVLLDCNMDDEVELKTLNSDKEGRWHVYLLKGVDAYPVGTFDTVNNRYTPKLAIRLLFDNYDLNKED